MAANVLTLVAASSTAPGIDAACEAAVAALRRLGAQIAGRSWLAPGVACDIGFAELDTDQADAAVRAALDPAFGAIDLIAQPAEGRRKRLLLADMESTIIVNEMVDDLAETLDLRPQMSEITRRAMNDEIDFAAALRERVALLKGLPERALAQAAARIQIMPGARTLVATMRAHGAQTVLVSGGFRVFTSQVRAELGFDLDLGNDLVMDGDRLAGRVREPILARDAKLDALKRIAAEHRLPFAATLAVGDGANDIGMVTAAGLGIAYHGKPALTAVARSRIDHCDLTALLYAQGYRAAELLDS
jgi:phosphoserine phosphatase